MTNDLVPEPPRLVTRKDLLESLVRLGPLPRRAGDVVEIDEKVFAIAMQDARTQAVVVAAVDLDVATRRIIAGALGHGFHPSPPELRTQCEKAKAERVDVLHRQLRDRRILREMEDRRASLVERTDEERARVRARAQEAMRSLGAVPDSHGRKART